MAGRFTLFKITSGLSHFTSSVLSPMLVPTYGCIVALWASVMCSLPLGTRITVVLIMMGLTCILPVICISVLHHYGFVTNKALKSPRERIVPYLFSIACYIAAAYYLHDHHSPQWFVMYAVGITLALIITSLINLKWKISAHMTGMGGLVALIYQIHVQGLSAFNLFWVLILAILLSGILGTGRLVLKRHNVWQVLAGFACSYACVTFAMKLFG